jgi:hypothetical protein
LSDAQILASYNAGPDTVVGDYSAPVNPSPANGSTSQALSLTLNWTSDSTADITGHRVYMGTDYTSVLNATTSSTGIYQGTTASGITSFPVTLQTDTQYYWRIEDVLSTGATLKGTVWAFIRIIRRQPIRSQPAAQSALRFQEQRFHGQPTARRHPTGLILDYPRIHCSLWKIIIFQQAGQPAY